MSITSLCSAAIFFQCSDRSQLRRHWPKCSVVTPRLMTCHTRCASLDFIHQKTKMRRFPCIFCWEATEGCIGERSLEVIPASVRGPCPLTILSLVTPELPPPGIFCDSAKTTASMRQNREVGICLRHSCSRPKLYAAIRSPIVRALADFDSEK